VVVEIDSPLLRAVPAAERSRLRRQSQPRRLAPMLATLTAKHFSDPGWIFERKLDGVRCVALRRSNHVRLLSRNGLEIGAAYPELVHALARERCDDFIVDGEVVAFDGKQTSFSQLQRRVGVRDPDSRLVAATPVYLYLFDVLHVDGWRTTALSQLARKDLLRRMLRYRDPVRYTEHRAQHGERFLAEACREGWEGLIAKKADAPYVHKRSRCWLKFKCVAGQELVIAGYTDPQGSREGFGALLVGYYERGALRYAGKVGTGFDHETLARLTAKFRRLSRSTCPFDEVPREPRAHWVSPELVGEFGFTEWTRDGKLRHPRFLGLRADKKASSVRREAPKSV